MSIIRKEEKNILLKNSFKQQVREMYNNKKLNEEFKEEIELLMEAIDFLEGNTPNVNPINLRWNKFFSLFKDYANV